MSQVSSSADLSKLMMLSGLVGLTTFAMANLILSQLPEDKADEIKEGIIDQWEKIAIDQLSRDLEERTKQLNSL